MSATEAEEDALCSLAAFIADNTCPRNAALFVWFKDAPEKLVSLRYAVDRLEVSGIFPEGTKYRCIRSLLDLAAATDYAPHARSAWHVTRSLTRDIKRSKSAKSGSA